MIKQYAIVRYDAKRTDEYYDHSTGEWVEVRPNLCFDSRESAEDVMSGLKKDSAFDYSVERVH